MAKAKTHLSAVCLVRVSSKQEGKSPFISSSCQRFPRRRRLLFLHPLPSSNFLSANCQCHKFRERAAKSLRLFRPISLETDETAILRRTSPLRLRVAPPNRFILGNRILKADDDDDAVVLLFQARDNKGRLDRKVPFEGISRRFELTSSSLSLFFSTFLHLSIFDCCGGNSNRKAAAAAAADLRKS